MKTHYKVTTIRPKYNRDTGQYDAGIERHYHALCGSNVKDLVNEYRLITCKKCRRKLGLEDKNVK